MGRAGHDDRVGAVVVQPFALENMAQALEKIIQGRMELDAAKGWPRSYLTDGERAAILDAIKSAYELGKAAADEAKES
mgnify:CR=1 FL=1